MSRVIRRSVIKNQNIQFKTTTGANIKLLKLLSLSFVSSLVLTFTAWAGSPGLEGVVKDPARQPVKGAAVRVGAKNFSKVVKADASGYYICDGLAVGTYKVTLVVTGSIKASILNAKTQLGKTTQLNFDLTAKTASATRHIHSVYCPTETGTLIGGLTGRWIDVDDNGNIVSDTGRNSSAGISSVEKVSGSALQIRPSRPDPLKYGGE
jgi:hypothetical protein